MLQFSYSPRQFCFLHSHSLLFIRIYTSPYLCMYLTMFNWSLHFNDLPINSVGCCHLSIAASSIIFWPSQYSRQALCSCSFISPSPLPFSCYNCKHFCVYRISIGGGFIVSADPFASSWYLKSISRRLIVIVR
jgi:hypothetical protein